MPVALAEESSLPDAVDQLYSAVARLVDTRKELIGGAVLAAPSLYDALVGDLPARTGENGGRFIGRSLPPLWVDALDARREIDDRVKTWHPGGASTPNRLRAVAARRWRPQDTRQVRDMAAEVQSWALKITGLLEPAHVKTIAAPCPSCGRGFVFRKDSAGETVRQPALQLVANIGCTCQACKAFWEPSRYLFLVRLLGFDLPAGIDP